jgi:hypothetical protein
VTAARVRALLLGLIAALAIAAVMFAFARPGPTPTSPPARAADNRPTLLLLTSLPLMFGDDFALEDGGSPALTALRKDYRVVPISVASPAELAKGRLLLMAQPIAQPAEYLVAIDDWVRAGGRVLLLADPLLEWPSAQPPGDPTRPPPMFADTGLLGHWGLRLDAPEERGPRKATLDGSPVLTVSAGRLSGNGCEIGSGGLVAHCRIGAGSATVIADADLLDADAFGNDGAANLDAVLSQLTLLRR